MQPPGTMAAMFYAIPLDSRPTWRNPPWMTVLLILINMAVFWGPQRTEEAAQERAAAYYLQSPLPALEIPAFVAWLDDTGHKDAAKAHKLQKAGAKHHLLRWMEFETVFQQRLRAGLVVPDSHPQHGQWQEARTHYEALQPPPFTERWAQDYTPDAPSRPITWLTATFLHGSTGHLLGNMVFLFLFGFSMINISNFSNCFLLNQYEISDHQILRYY